MAVMNAIVNANDVAEDAPDSAGAVTAVMENQPPVAEGSTAVVLWWRQVKSKCRRVVNRHKGGRRGEENGPVRNQEKTSVGRTGTRPMRLLPIIATKMSTRGRNRKQRANL
jgi:hypothetical protein